MRLTSRAIIELVEAEYEISLKRKPNSRARSETRWPRFIAMKLCREYLGFSLPAIGRIFDVAHNCVWYAICKVDAEIEAGTDVANQYADLAAKVEARRQEIAC